MATIDDAIRQGVLEEYVMSSHELRVPRRRLYASPDFYDWLDETPQLRALKAGARTLHEQAEQLLSDLRCERKPACGDVRRMLPNDDRVWSVHAPKLRLYGWFTPSSEFVAITGAVEADTKADKKLNDKKRDEVLGFAKVHELTPTMIEGDIRALFKT